MYEAKEREKKATALNEVMWWPLYAVNNVSRRLDSLNVSALVFAILWLNANWKKITELHLLRSESFYVSANRGLQFIQILLLIMHKNI